MWEQMYTRLHSSRMCTTHALTISPSKLCMGGVPGPRGVYLVGGVPGPGGCVPGPRGLCTWSGGVYLTRHPHPLDLVRYSPL